MRQTTEEVESGKLKTICEWHCPGNQNFNIHLGNLTNINAILPRRGQQAPQRWPVRREYDVKESFKAGRVAKACALSDGECKAGGKINQHRLKSYLGCTASSRTSWADNQLSDSPIYWSGYIQGMEVHLCGLTLVYKYIWNPWLNSSLPLPLSPSLLPPSLLFLLLEWGWNMGPHSRQKLYHQALCPALHSFVHIPHLCE